jgi:CrcB protein
MTDEVAPGGSRPPPHLALRGRWDILLVVAAGGAVGSLGRWALTEAFPHGEGQPPWGTVVANLTGAFLLGALMVLVLDLWPSRRYVRPFLGVGVLGGYTTFSTYMLDARDLLATGQAVTAFGYLFGTLLGGLVAVWAGAVLARALVASAVRRNRHRRARAPSRDRAQTPDGAAPSTPDQPTTRSPR